MQSRFRAATLCATSALLAFALSACGPKAEQQSSNPPPAPAATNNPPGPLPDTNKNGTGMDEPSKNPNGAPGDAIITAKVKSALIGDKSVRASTINVDTKSNVVVLRGTVANEAAKTKAEQIAKKTQGVKEVVNQLTVKP
jgi:hypothetical protein